MQSTTATLLLVFKKPALNYAKQRLANSIGATPALRVAEGMLRCALEDAESWPGPVVLSPANAADRHWAQSLLARPAQVEPQVPGNLGERISDIDRRLRRSGHECLVTIGSDAPTLDDDYYGKARHALQNYDVVLGPARDGGVTLMAGAVPWPRLDDLAWSSPRLGDMLTTRCADNGLSVALLPMRADVDDLDDLAALSADLQNDARPARRRLRALVQTCDLPEVEQRVDETAADEDRHVRPPC